MGNSYNYVQNNHMIESDQTIRKERIDETIAENETFGKEKITESPENRDWHISPIPFDIIHKFGSADSCNKTEEKKEFSVSGKKSFEFPDSDSDEKSLDFSDSDEESGRENVEIFQEKKNDFEFGARVLICVRPNCTICDKPVVEQYSELTLEFNYGWRYCDDCKNNGKLKRAVLYEMELNKLLPCNFLMSSKFKRPSFYETMITYDTETEKYIEEKTIDSENQYSAYFHFFSDSQELSGKNIQTVEMGKTIINPFLLKTTKDGSAMAIVAHFIDNTKNSNCKAVRLSNLFYHNKGLYEDIISASDILMDKESNVIISYNEIPKIVRDLVERARVEAETCADPRKLELNI